MIVNTQKLLDEIDLFEINEFTDVDKVPISRLTISETISLKRRKIIDDFCKLAERFNKSIVEE